MINKIFVPPIKCQGIKTKLIPSIAEIVKQVDYDRWVEPFFGSGVVGFNTRPEKAIFCDSNPHIIKFYSSLKSGEITPQKAKAFLEEEGEKLNNHEGEYYYTVRERFNNTGDSFDFLFLNRSCFNGMMRFNRKGGFNVPFCKKPNRFSQSYITKITNQIKFIQEIINDRDYSFVCQPFQKTLASLESGDLIYCDPPYIGRHVDYFDSWSESDEIDLHRLLTNSNAKFILSTWHSNDYRKNEYIESLWTDLNIITREHFYHVGGSEDNRNPMLEALITNFNASITSPKRETAQAVLF
jgi:DNA adenine methylase